jgi:hypothetical protein
MARRISTPTLQIAAAQADQAAQAFQRAAWCRSPMKASMLSRISTLALKAQLIALASHSNAASAPRTTMVIAFTLCSASPAASRCSPRFVVGH